MSAKPCHPAAETFPLLEGSAFRDLVADLQAHGLREPIVVDAQGLILDGRNRSRACLAASVVPHYRVWDGIGSPLAYVLSANLHRRHLDESQRAMVAARLATLKQGARTDLSSIDERLSQSQAAVLLNVAVPSITRARGVLEAGSPELIRAVDQGQISVSQASQIAAEAPEVQQAIIEKVDAGERPAQAVRQVRREQRHRVTPTWPEGVFRVLYADPPWQYADSGVIQHGDNYGRAERHYPTLSITELATLPVLDRVADDAVLFLWVTSPMLAECWPVIAAWGFRYKTSIIWDKVAHNYGHYVSVRHELLLICTRGSCLPDRPTPMPDSVRTIRRSATHSEKPAAFRQLIEQMYDGPRLELFARSDHEGWTTFGDQVPGARLASDGAHRRVLIGDDAR